jgi:hypothetical protein
MIALTGFFLFRSNGQGAKVEIKIAQKLYGIYDLSMDQEIIIMDKDGQPLITCFINDGKIQVVSSDCPDKICIEDGAIELNGQTIVCLPNQIVIKVIGEDSELDGVLK